MTRSKKDEYDKKIAGALRKQLAEECRLDAPEGAGPENASIDTAWLEKPVKRAKNRQLLQRFGRVAAVFLLGLITGFGILCASSSEVRANVGGTFKQLYERWQGEIKRPEQPIPNSPAYFTQRASYTDEENDWYYELSFGRQPGLNDFATFIGLDLRHRYEEGRWAEVYQQESVGGEDRYMINRVQATGRWFGQGSDAEKRDRKLVNEILKKALDPAISGDPDPADYSFEVLDKDLFFDLLKEALAAAPDEWTGKRRDSTLSTEILVEPEWQDGYRFQIISPVRQSGIDEVYIDVLYKTGDGFNDYVQLSDLAEEGKADALQQELFLLLQDVRAAIKEKNSFTAMEAVLKEKSIEGVDLSRLITFLQDLESAEPGVFSYSNYDDDPNILPWETVFITKEEWEEHVREVSPSWFINREKMEERLREQETADAE